MTLPDAVGHREVELSQAFQPPCNHAHGVLQRVNPLQCRVVHSQQEPVIGQVVSPVLHQEYDGGQLPLHGTVPCLCLGQPLCRISYHPFPPRLNLRKYSTNGIVDLGPIGVQDEWFVQIETGICQDGCRQQHLLQVVHAVLHLSSGLEALVVLEIILDQALKQRSGNTGVVRNKFPVVARFAQEGSYLGPGRRTRPVLDNFDIILRRRDPLGRDDVAQVFY